MINNYEIITGADNFRELVSTDQITVDPNKLFVDKTLFIKNFLDSSGKVLLITRPRRWGKTLALSMLQHFLSKEVDGLPTKDLFNNLKITKLELETKYKIHQGQYPVIFVSFKDLKSGDYADLQTAIIDIIAELYNEHSEFILKQKLTKVDCDKFERVLDSKCSYGELLKSIKFLSKLLCKYYGKKVFILIDEYDNAINNAFDNPELLKKLTDFFSDLFGSCLKGNKYLEKGLVTGILRVAKANIFSGLNNLEEYTVLDPEFTEHYGFTEVEVNSLLDRSGISNKKEIKAWYNGYIMGKYTLYNPWSIMRCIGRKGYLDKYWVNSGNPKIIEDLIINKSSLEDKQKIRDLIKYKEALLKIDLKKQVSFDDLQYQPYILWSLLIHTGYLTLVKESDKRHIKIPNQEVALLVKDYVDNWFIVESFLSKTANSLLMGDFISFEDSLKKIFGDPAYSARIFSGGGRAANTPETEKTKEFVYQFLIMTELRCVNIADNADYEVFAEIDDVSIGKTRPDVLVINHKKKLCIVVEIKSAMQPKEDLKKLANVALTQITKNQYGKKYQEQGYKILPLGLAFKGDKFELSYEGQSDLV